MNTFGAIPGFLGTYISGAILDATHDWNLMYMITGTVTSFGWAVFAYWGTSEPIIPWINAEASVTTITCFIFIILIQQWWFYNEMLFLPIADANVPIANVPIASANVPVPMCQLSISSQRYRPKYSNHPYQRLTLFYPMLRQTMDTGAKVSAPRCDCKASKHFLWIRIVMLNHHLGSPSFWAVLVNVPTCVLVFRYLRCSVWASVWFSYRCAARITVCYFLSAWPQLVTASTTARCWWIRLTWLLTIPVSYSVSLVHIDVWFDSLIPQ